MKLESRQGVQATIRVGKQALKEYDDIADELYIPNMGRRYVEVESGAEFDVHLVTERTLIPPSPLDSVAIHVFLDGQFIPGAIVDRPSQGSQQRIVDGKVETVGGQSMKRKFTFADLVTGVLVSRVASDVLMC